MTTKKNQNPDNYYDYRLPCGKRLGDATAADLEAAEEHFRKEEERQRRLAALFTQMKQTSQTHK